MIADSLRLEVEAHARRVLASSELLRRASVGEVGVVIVGRYLASLRFLLEQTQAHLGRARDRARDLESVALARYFEQKLEEERGHDHWAAQDLRVLMDGGRIGGAFAPVPAILELAHFIESTIDDDPRDYLAYVLWAEYFTVLVGGVFVNELVGRCGIDGNALTCLARHVELDADHADEGLDAIDRLIDDPARLRKMLAVVQLAGALFDRACDQMLEPAEPAAHVPTESWSQRAAG